MIHYFLKRLLLFSNLHNTPKFSLENKKTYCKVVKVYDGDTITINMRLHKKLYQFNVRMYGYDTPEIRTKDLIEKEKGLEAQLFLKNLILDKLVYIHCHEFDKYGRLLGTIYLSKSDCKNKRSINEEMVVSNHAVPYFGGKK